MVGEITSMTIKSAIAKRIRTAFATGSTPNIVYPTIYKEQIQQGIVKPYFFIWTINRAQRKWMRYRWGLTFQMQVRYHPTDNDLAKYETLETVGAKLLETLSTIEVPISLNGTTETTIVAHGRELEYRIEDDVLLAYATYSLSTVAYTTPLADMEDLLLTETVPN